MISFSSFRSASNPVQTYQMTRHYPAVLDDMDLDEAGDELSDDRLAYPGETLTSSQALVTVRALRTRYG